MSNTFNPVSIQKGTNASYTCPAGKYALITITAEGYATAIGTPYPNNGLAYPYYVQSPTSNSPEKTINVPGSFNNTICFWVASGDVVSYSSSVASGSSAFTNRFTYNTVYNLPDEVVTATTSLTIAHNSTTISNFTALAAFTWNIGSNQMAPGSGVAYFRIGWTGSTNFSWIAQEYTN
jgi:hypothetical protein